jgi:hypothetical protein
VWPNERVVAEMDPAGTDLALRLRLAPEPTILALAADARPGLPGGVLRYAQPTVLGIPVVVGAETAERFGPMARLWPWASATPGRARSSPWRARWGSGRTAYGPPSADRGPTVRDGGAGLPGSHA